MFQAPYGKYLAEQFTIAYDVYLDIQRRIDLKIKTALQRNDPDWRLRNVCPPCFYKLDDEDELKYSFFFSIDGNNSLKRMGAEMHETTTRLDSRNFTHDRWVSPMQVNSFANEVRKQTVCRAAMNYSK